MLLDVIQRARLPYDVDELAGRVTATADAAVPFLQVTMTDEDPDRAAQVANALAEILVSRSATQGDDGSTHPGVLEDRGTGDRSEDAKRSAGRLCDSDGCGR